MCRTDVLYIVFVMYTNVEGETKATADFVYDDLDKARSKFQEIVRDFEVFNSSRSMVIAVNESEMFSAYSHRSTESAHVRILHRKIIIN